MRTGQRHIEWLTRNRAEDDALRLSREPKQANIDPLFCERLQLRVGRHLRKRQVYVWRRMPKRAQHTRQNVIGCRPNEPQIERAAHSSTRPLGREHGFVSARQNQSCAVEKYLSRGSDLYSAPVSKEQLHQQLFF